MKKEIAKNIFEVGVSDWNVRNFHGYLTPYGSSYNAYLILDEKITLIDTVKAPFSEELVERISEVVDLEKIDYVVCNHVEMDHSGGMPVIMQKAKNATVITTAKAQNELKLHYDTSSWKWDLISSGDTRSLGQRELVFVTTPMVHWPENMVTYCPQEKILFSNDAFGQHIAHSEIFADEMPWDFVCKQAKGYYANIVMPYSAQVLNALKTVGGLDVQMIAPSHGLIFRKNIKQYLDLYTSWANGETKKKAVIVYDTMWHSTEKIAQSVAKAFENKGYVYKMFNLQANHISTVIEDCLDAEYICVGSPTLNKGIMPSVAGFMTYLQGLIYKSKKGFLFGSYGWAPLNMKFMQRFFDESSIELVDTCNAQFVPTKEKLQEITKQIEEKIS